MPNGCHRAGVFVAGGQVGESPIPPALGFGLRHSFDIRHSDLGIQVKTIAIAGREKLQAKTFALHSHLWHYFVIVTTIFTNL